MGVAHLFSSLNLHIKQHGKEKKKRKKWCGSSVASGKFLNSPALGFSICKMESLPTQGHRVGSPWLRGCHGQPTSLPSSLDLDLNQSLLEGRDSWPTIQGRNGFPPLDCVWTALSGERERGDLEVHAKGCSRGLSPRSVAAGRINAPLAKEHLLVLLRNAQQEG